MVFKRTTPITALDLDSSDLPDATSSSKGGVTLKETVASPTVPAIGGATWLKQNVNNVTYTSVTRDSNGAATSATRGVA
jgi:hypothetical protein